MRAEVLEIKPEELAIVKSILNSFIPDRTIWAFGSRVGGRTKKFSDLDLMILGEHPLPHGTIGDVADAFAESDLPYKVDLVEWASASESFRGIVAKSHVEL